MPLLSKQYRELFSRYSVKAFFSALRMHLRTWLGKQEPIGEDGLRLDPDNMHNVHNQLQGLGPTQANRVRRREFGRVSRAFIRLIRWGKRHDIVFTATSAPGTYAQTLSEHFPEHEKRLTEIADCFEQAIYSPWPLGKERLNEYENAIKKIIRER